MRSFNGTSDGVTATGGQAYTGSRAAFSAALWVKGAAKANQVVYSEALNSTSGFFAFDTDASTGALLRTAQSPFGGGTNILDVNSTATVFDGTLHHICFTQDVSGNWAIYIDGVLDHSGTISTAKTGTCSWVTIGYLKRTTSTAFFTGSLGEAANWTRQLSAGEAASLAAGLPASHFAPAHYWPLWGADSPEPDIGTAAHVTGVLTGTAFASGGKVAGDLLSLGTSTVGV